MASLQKKGPRWRTLFVGNKGLLFHFCSVGALPTQGSPASLPIPMFTILLSAHDAYTTNFPSNEIGSRSCPPKISCISDVLILLRLADPESCANSFFAGHDPRTEDVRGKFQPNTGGIGAPLPDAPIESERAFGILKAGLPDTEDISYIRAAISQPCIPHLSITSQTYFG